jgi:hypothetical protein
MKNVLLAAVVLVPAVAGAVSMESLRAGADAEFALAPLAARAAVQAASARELQIQQAPLTPRALGRDEARGLEAGRVNLAAQLDKNLFLLKDTFGSRSLDLGLVVDQGAKERFMSFTDANGTVLGAIGSLSDLRGKGVDIRIDASTVYNFRVEVGSIFDDPVHKSILHMTPVSGTSGPSHDMTTGALLDDVRAKSALVTISGDEYWIFYGRDAKKDGSGFSTTRSFLITHEAGMSTKAWPLDESSLKLDVPSEVTLGDVKAVLTRTSGGELIVNDAN